MASFEVISSLPKCTQGTNIISCIPHLTGKPLTLIDPRQIFNPIANVVFTSWKTSFHQNIACDVAKETFSRAKSACAEMFNSRSLVTYLATWRLSTNKTCTSQRRHALTPFSERHFKLIWTKIQTKFTRRNEKAPQSGRQLIVVSADMALKAIWHWGNDRRHQKHSQANRFYRAGDTTSNTCSKRFIPEIEMTAFVSLRVIQVSGRNQLKNSEPRRAVNRQVIKTWKLPTSLPPM